MKINTATMLFTDLTSSQADEMQCWAEDVVLRGVIASPQPEWVTEWFKACGFDERQGLLVVSTALPQRVLLSVLLHDQGRRNE